MLLNYIFIALLYTHLALVSYNSAFEDGDLANIFGKNVNKKDAWSKLLDLEGCPKPELWDGTIIMVNESGLAGARFIGSPNVTSRYQCEFECCFKQQKGCNIAVYTAEQKHCYLFDCGRPSKCKFDQHSGYSVSSIAEQLASKEDVAKATTQASTTAASPTTQAAPKQLHLLDGCRPGTDVCITENTECSRTGFCTCQHGFHPKNGVCRQDCLQGLQFECTNGNAKYDTPDCVAIYDVCDGTPQCPDGSDEKDCDEDDEKFDWSKLGDIATLKAALQGYIKSHSKNSTTVALPTTAAVTGSKHSDGHVNELAALTLVSQQLPATLPANQTSSSIIDPANNQTSSLLNMQVIEMEKEGGIDNGSRSAIIALALTVTLSLVLLVYLSCRYRYMRRRMGRHGKAMNGSEVDYLIDGMYL